MSWWKKNGRKEKWLGGYELTDERDDCKPGIRMFTLERIPVRGVCSKRTLYFTSHQAAKARGWKKCQ